MDLHFSKNIAIFRMLRISNWIKNVLVFIPLVFGGRFEVNTILVMLRAFMSFSLITSAIYIINDIRDLENDKNHPVKCRRPLASGKVSATCGLYLIVILLCAGVLICPGGGK